MIGYIDRTLERVVVRNSVHYTADGNTSAAQMVGGGWVADENYTTPLVAEGNSGNLDDIRGKLYTFQTGQWPANVWFIRNDCVYPLLIRNPEPDEAPPETLPNTIHHTQTYPDKYAY